ncbi:MAG: HPr family phosphocarrier protein [Spirochaetales bacterium]|nr:HPr family phosphocarrier protein [Spirochaetales bacterium]
MISKEIEITNPKGIHARPSTMIVQASLKFDSEIFLQKDGVKVSASNIMSILTLAAVFGDKLMIIVDGPDDKEAMDHMVEIFRRKFDDN